MSDIEKIIQWIESGKQLGKVFSFECNGKTIWSSVGIQKWNDIYKVYVDEIEEEKMSDEEYRRNEIQRFVNISDAISYIDSKTKMNLMDLRPCKGQKIFNPNFE